MVAVQGQEFVQLVREYEAKAFLPTNRKYSAYAKVSTHATRYPTKFLDAFLTIYIATTTTQCLEGPLKRSILIRAEEQSFHLTYDQK
jgi:hypothetical protein